jgi:hypothetical protein
VTGPEQEPADASPGQDRLLRVVIDRTERMPRLLREIYAQSDDILASSSPSGLIPLETIDAQLPAWHGVHARTTIAPQRTTIKVSLGLVHLLYRMNRAFALRVRLDDEMQSPQGDAAAELAVLVDRASAPMLPIGTAPPLPERQVQVAELYTHWGEKFLLNHELAHAHGIDQASLDYVPILSGYLDRFSTDPPRAPARPGVRGRSVRRVAVDATSGTTTRCLGVPRSAFLAGGAATLRQNGLRSC